MVFHNITQDWIINRNKIGPRTHFLGEHRYEAHDWMALQFMLQDLTAWYGSTIENNSNDLIRVCSFRKMQHTSWFFIRWIRRFWKRTSWIWNPKNINPPMQLGPFNFCILVFIKYIYELFSAFDLIMESWRYHDGDGDGDGDGHENVA